MGKIITQYFFAWDEWVMVRTFSDFFLRGTKFKGFLINAFLMIHMPPDPLDPKKLLI